jgi:oligopeptide/dipeptide ABC transporter ATP-binding protein
MERLLEVSGLSTTFKTWEGELQAVRGVSFSLAAGETLALVGESGCGKSVTARSIMGLYAGSRVVQQGSIAFRGEELSTASPARRAALRGGKMAMIFQEPMAAFDPLATVGEQMIDARLAHVPDSGGAGAAARAARAAATELAIAALRGVGIPDPEIRFRDYPHRLSGGMLQRVLIATALLNEPELLVADEPTTALDVTIQAQVLRLVRELRVGKGMGVLFITHDLGVVAEIADRVHVMYAGKIVEKATVAEFFGAAGSGGAGGATPGPLHPYGRGLLSSRVRRELKGAELPAVPGTVPRPSELPAGCAFAPRCAKAGPRCLREEPVLAPVAGTAPAPGAAPREAACWLHQGGVA